MQPIFYFSNMFIDALFKKFERDPTVKRHLLKTVSWRIVGSLDTMLLGWLITGKIGIGSQIGGMELITKMVLYFIHERAWHKSIFGIPTRIKKAAKIKKEIAPN